MPPLFERSYRGAWWAVTTSTTAACTKSRPIEVYQVRLRPQFLQTAAPLAIYGLRFARTSPLAPAVSPRGRAGEHQRAPWLELRAASAVWCQAKCKRRITMGDEPRQPGPPLSTRPHQPLVLCRRANDSARRWQQRSTHAGVLVRPQPQHERVCRRIQHDVGASGDGAGAGRALQVCVQLDNMLQPRVLHPSSPSPAPHSSAWAARCSHPRALLTSCGWYVCGSVACTCSCKVARSRAAAP